MRLICPLLQLAAIIFLFQGCSTALDESNDFIDKEADSSVLWEKEGLSFEYPSKMSVSTDNFTPGSDIDIFVDNKNIHEFIEPCVEAHLDVEGLDIEQLREEYLSSMLTLKEDGVDESVETFENLACGWAGGNVYSEPMEIQGYNGVLHHKALAQEIGSLTVFYTQVLFVDDYDNVHSIVFSYDFGDLEKVIDHFRGEFGEAYYKGEDSTAEEAWQEVMDYMTYGKEIELDALKGFMKNRKVIEDIIDTISLNEDKVEKTATYEPPEYSYIKDDLDVSELAFIDVPAVNKLKKSSNGAYYIYGSTSPNCFSITVTAENSDAGMKDVYELATYNYGDSSFKYGIREDLKNLADGTNIYKFKAYCEGDQVKTDYAVFEFHTEKTEPEILPPPKQPAVAQPPVKKPAPVCDPNYTGCVPVASDVDCAGGSGNGPAYVRGPVNVIGRDIYGLDRDNDGLGCE